MPVFKHQLRKRNQELAPQIRSCKAPVGICSHCGRTGVKLRRSKYLETLVCWSCYPSLAVKYRREMEREQESLSEEFVHQNRNRYQGREAPVGDCERCGRKNVKLRLGYEFSQEMCRRCYSVLYGEKYRKGLCAKVSTVRKGEHFADKVTRELGAKYFPDYERYAEQDNEDVRNISAWAIARCKGIK